MKLRDSINILSEHRLQPASLDFLESLKIDRYHTENRSRFETIQFVNNSPEVAKKIFQSEYNSTFADGFKLDVAEVGDDFTALKNIGSRRRSSREYLSESLSFRELSSFLHLTYRVTQEKAVQLKNGDITKERRRNIGSGGGIYSAEVFVVNRKISDIPIGAYHYDIFNSELKLVNTFDDIEEGHFNEAIFNSGGEYTAAIELSKASAIVIFTSILNKHSFKYQDFGLLLAMIEIGELTNAAYLSAAAINLGCCPFGGFMHRQLHKILDLKNSLHQPMMCMALGKI